MKSVDELKEDILKNLVGWADALYGLSDGEERLSHIANMRKSIGLPPISSSSTSSRKTRRNSRGSRKKRNVRRRRLSKRR